MSKTLAESYAAKAIEAGHEVRIPHLHDIDFDMDYGYTGYSYFKPLEPVLEKVLEDLEWCEHFVMSTPMWWGGLPDKLKGLIDRAFLPGRTFDTRNLKMGMPTPMLKGRSARVVITTDTPKIVLRLIYKNAMECQIRKHIVEFIGIKPTKITQFSGASHASSTVVESWTKKVKALAANAS